MITPSTIQLESVDGGTQQVEPTVFVSNGFTYSLDPNTRELSIWLFSDIHSDLHEYLPLLIAINTVTSEYIIHFYIDSPGGALMTTYAICSALAASPAKVHTHNAGIACSCGSLILMVGDKISLAPYAITMFHDASMGAFGNAHDGKTKFDFCNKQIETLTAMFIEKGALTEEEVVEINNGKEFYFDRAQMSERLKTNNLLIDFGS